MSNKNLYRKAVSAVIKNRTGLIFICQSSNNKKGWQLPQGGVRKGENLVDAIHRELIEELGSNKFRVRYKIEGEYFYDWPIHHKQKPDKIIGQSLTFFLVQYEGNDYDFKIPNSEISKFKWSSQENLQFKLFINYKRDIYKQIFSLIST
jgi:putative (di)nucleoside polyphosphate hydrolase